MENEDDKFEVTVRLMGKGAELLTFKDGNTLPSHNVKVLVSELTPRKILEGIANKNPLLKDQMVREDGTPRSSTKILIDGKPPGNLDRELATRKIISSDGGIEIDIILGPIEIIIYLPCDG